MGAAKDTSDVMDDANVNEALPPVPTTAGAPADAPAGPMPAGGGNRAVLPTAVTPMDPVMAEIKQSLTRLDTALTDLKLQAQHDRKELEDLLALNAPPPAPATDTDLTNTASADSSSTSESAPSEAVDDEPPEVEPPAAEPPVQAAAPAADAPPPIRLLAFGAKPAAAKTAPTSTDQHRRRRQKYVSLGVSRFRQSPQYVPLRDDLYRHQNRASIKAFTKAFVKSVDAYLTAKRLDKMQALDELRAYEAMDIEMPLQYLRGENAEKLTENDRRRFYTQRITAPPTYAAAAAAAPSTIDEVIAQRDQGRSTGGGGGGGGGGYGGKRPGGGARDGGKPKKIRADRNTCRHCFEHFANGFPAQHLQDCAVLKRKKAMAA